MERDNDEEGQGDRESGVCKIVLPDGVRSMGYAAKSTVFNVFVFGFRTRVGGGLGVDSGVGRC